VTLCEFVWILLFESSLQFSFSFAVNKLVVLRCLRLLSKLISYLVQLFSDSCAFGLNIYLCLFCNYIWLYSPLHLYSLPYTAHFMISVSHSFIEQTPRTSRTLYVFTRTSYYIISWTVYSSATYRDSYSNAAYTIIVPQLSWTSDYLVNLSNSFIYFGHS
jgi:hypothetical protein